MDDNEDRVATDERERAQRIAGANGAKRKHKATFATDKRNPGQYLIRIEGPTASAFAGREVPVTRKDDTETIERLTKCIWSGVDDNSGKPVALYKFEAKPKDTDDVDELPF